MQGPRASLRIFLTIIFFAAGPSTLAKEVEFRFEKADAQKVEVLGEFNDWKAQPMTKQSDGTWTITVSIGPGTHGYKFLVNGTDWVFDPKNSNRKTVNGVENSAMEVTEAGATSTVTPPPTATVAFSPAFDRSTSTNLRETPARPVGTTPTISVTPGQVSNFDAPLSVKQRAAAMREGNPAVTTAKITLGVPNGFDPTNIYPLLVISATVDYPNSSLFPRYQKEAMEAGWVVMAADGADKPKEDHGDWRWAMISAGVDAIEASWPAAKKWPVACGGFSGGAKRSGFMAGRFAKTPHKVIGMLMGGVNQDMASESLQKDQPPFGMFVRVPIFLSSGTADTIATPEQHQNVMQSMKASGFLKVRLESYTGAHDPYPQHTTEALNWFMAESSQGSSTQRKSDFDKFFKKNREGLLNR